MRVGGEGAPHQPQSPVAGVVDGAFGIGVDLAGAADRSSGVVGIPQIGRGARYVWGKR